MCSIENASSPVITMVVSPVILSAVSILPDFFRLHSLHDLRGFQPLASNQPMMPPSKLFLQANN
jgi:hypothetical protein